MRTPSNEPLAPAIAEAPSPNKRANARKCILSGEHKAREQMIRLALAPADSKGMCTLWPDPAAKAPGRGAWLGASRARLEQAIARGQFKGALARAFKSGTIGIADDLPQRIEEALRAALLDRLGLEKRAGHLILGTQRIDDAARKGEVRLLLHARDASEGGCRKLDAAWRVGEAEEGSAKRGTLLPLDREALSVALGRENAVHLALTDQGAAMRIGWANARLLHYIDALPGNTQCDAGSLAPCFDTQPNA